ncbi:MAG: hypothetical protein AAFQ50_10570, partial [Pseudomonadota bacterium]
MTDDLDRLRGDVPAPHPAARAAAIGAGLGAYDQEYTKQTQGSARATRLSNVLQIIRSKPVVPHLFS